MQSHFSLVERRPTRPVRISVYLNLRQNGVCKVPPMEPFGLLICDYKSRRHTCTRKKAFLSRLFNFPENAAKRERAHQHAAAAWAMRRPFKRHGAASPRDVSNQRNAAIATCSPRRVACAAHHLSVGVTAAVTPPRPRRAICTLAAFFCFDNCTKCHYRPSQYPPPPPHVSRALPSPLRFHVPSFKRTTHSIGPVGTAPPTHSF